MVVAAVKAVLGDGVAVNHGGWEDGDGRDHDDSGKVLVVMMGSGAGGE